MNTLQRTRVAGVWTRLGSDGIPQGKLHAARRSEGALEERALCGFKIPTTSLHRRPYPPFDETNIKACATCVVEVWDLA